MRMRKQIKLDNRIRCCFSCRERKKIVAVVATVDNKILYNYCKDCMPYVKNILIEQSNLKLVIKNE